ncbi:MAG: BatD family protein [Bacteroidia bacterium]|nr:BatD family protein [Bacteroidia bacterium]
MMSILFVLCSLSTFSQVSSTIDSTSIKIGEQILYKISVESDTTDFVVFPEGQTFQPLEMIESFKIDTTKKDAKYYLIKKYGLTQFDSGKYTIPQQKIVIGDKVLLTDSLHVEVNPVIVDTTKQKLYDIKPILPVDKSPTYWWLYTLMILLILALVTFLLYWFVWGVKPLTDVE